MKHQNQLKDKVKIEREKFKPGDKVRMKDGGSIVYGEVTIVTGTACKVMFFKDSAPPYDYYPQEQLEHYAGG